MRNKTVFWRRITTQNGENMVKYKTKFGLLCVRWYFQDNATIYEISIPKGIKARVEINNSCYNLEEGKYMFSHI